MWRDSRFIARADAMLEGLEVPAEQPQRPKRPTQRGKKGPTELDKANMARYEASLRDYAAALPLWRAAQLRCVMSLAASSTTRALRRVWVSGSGSTSSRNPNCSWNRRNAPGLAPRNE